MVLTPRTASSPTFALNSGRCTLRFFVSLMFCPFLVTVSCLNYCLISGVHFIRVAQCRHGHNLHDFDALFVQPHDLLAPFAELLQGLISCAFFFHQSSIMKIPENSNFMVLQQYLWVVFRPKHLNFADS